MSENEPKSGGSWWAVIALVLSAVLAIWAFVALVGVVWRWVTS
jgi:hypothetical protein